MTIKEYAKSRSGLSYDRAYRATISLGKARGSNWKPTDLTEEDVTQLDKILAEGPKRKKSSVQEFEAKRKEWVDTWAEAVLQAATGPELIHRVIVFGAIAYIRTNREWLDLLMDGSEVGNLIRSICLVTKVDLQPDGSTSGFTAWLAGEGYTFTKGVQS